jgi:hypothetical protein
VKKIAQNVRQSIFVKIYTYLLPRKKYPKHLGCFCTFQKLLKITQEAKKSQKSGHPACNAHDAYRCAKRHSCLIINKLLMRQSTFVIPSPSIATKTFAKN